LHGAEVARGLGIKQAITAPFAGVFSAFGFSCADIERYWIKGFPHLWREEIIDELNAVFNRLEKQANESSQGWGMGEKDLILERQVDLRYYRQASELTIQAPGRDFDAQDLVELRKAFDEEHLRTFNHSFNDSEVEVAAVRVVSKIPMPRPPLNGLTPRGRQTGSAPLTRKAYFGSDFGFIDTPVLKENDLGADPVFGPVLIDKYDTTLVIPPGCEIYAASSGCLVINTNGGERKS
jgi:N-methylhydantoinase A